MSNDSRVMEMLESGSSTVWREIPFTTPKNLSKQVWAVLGEYGFRSSTLTGLTCGAIVDRFNDIRHEHPDMLNAKNHSLIVFAFMNYGKMEALKVMAEVQQLDVSGRTAVKHGNAMLRQLARFNREDRAEMAQSIRDFAMMNHEEMF